MPNICVILCSRLRKVFCGTQTLVGGGDGGQNNINWLILPDAPPIIEQHCQQTLERKKRSYGHHDHGEMVRTPTKVISGLLSGVSQSVNQSLSMFEQVKSSRAAKNTLKIPSLNDWFFYSKPLPLLAMIVVISFKQMVATILQMKKAIKALWD